MRFSVLELVHVALALLLAMVLALRVVAQPILLSSAEPGVIALCLNGQIVYVSLETGQPVETEKKLGTADCPFSGVSSLSDQSSTLKFSANLTERNLSKSITKKKNVESRNWRPYFARSPPRKI